MTAAIGIDLGAEMAAGGQPGKGQSPLAAARLGKELSTNWLRPARGNLATGLASEAPSFRSSWQSQVNAWRGVSRGTNGVESEDASEAGAAESTNAAADGRAATNAQSSASAQAANSRLSGNVTVTQQNASATGATDQEGTLPRTNRFAWTSEPDAATQKASASTGSMVTPLSDAATRDRAGRGAEQVHRESTAAAATPGAQTVALAVQMPTLPPVTLASSEISAPANAAEQSSSSQSTFALSGWSSKQSLGGPESSWMESESSATGTLGAGISNNVTAAAVRAQPNRERTGSIAHSTAQMEESESAATGTLSAGISSSASAAGFRAQTPRERTGSIAHSTAQMEESESAATGTLAAGISSNSTAAGVHAQTPREPTGSIAHSTAQMGESESAATGTLAAGISSNSTAAGVRAQTNRERAGIIARNTAQSNATHGAAASSQDDASEPAADGAMTSLSSAEAWAANVQREPSIAETAASSESHSAQLIQNAKTGHLTPAAPAQSTVPSAAPFASVSVAAQTSADSVQDDSKSTAERVMPRTAFRDAAGETAATATPMVPAQLSSVDAAALGLLTPAAAHVSLAPTGDHAQFAAATSAAPAQDTFAALDAGTSPGTPAWTHAGGQHAEAGFRDPALGWVGVRADLDAGGIHATLVPSSAEAAQALNVHLAGLSTHLVEQQSLVASLTMASPSESGVESGVGQRMQQGAEGNPQRNVPEESQPDSQKSAPPAPRTFVQAAPAQAGNRDSLAHAGELRGTHISVMA